jgi:hypothetical protein
LRNNGRAASPLAAERGVRRAGRERRREKNDRTNCAPK